jgi:hypothetical protein
LLRVHAGSQSLPYVALEARVAENIGVTQGVHVHPILVDPLVYLINSADGPVAGNKDIDLAPHAPKS